MQTNGNLIDIRTEVLEALATGPHDYAQLINRPALRQTGGLAIREALDMLVGEGLATVSGGFETYRLAR
jgi:hypothetical protein